MTWTAKFPDLSQLSVSARSALLPPYLRKIIAAANSAGVLPKRIWLYGSRARGDARENSDFDVAFEISHPTKWHRFVSEVQENPPSLHKYDLIDYDQVESALRAAIEREGILIYESR